MYLLTKNVVVLKDDGVNVIFKGKCPRCGKVDLAQRTAQVIGGGIHNFGGGVCHCGQEFYDIAMTRSSYYKEL